MKTRLLIALSTLCLFCSSIVAHAEEYHYVFVLSCGTIVNYNHFRELEEWEIVAYAVRFEEGMCEEVEDEPIGE